MSLKDCYNFEDFRKLAKKNLPAPIFHYIDGGSDDETTFMSAYERQLALSDFIQKMQIVSVERGGF